MANHQHAFYVLLAIVFVCILSYMFLYNKRSKDRQKTLENHGVHVDSKEAGIMEAQESMKHERRQK